MSNKYKVCSRCNCNLPATTEYFGANSRYKDGLRSWCKECTNEYSRQHYEQNREKRLEQYSQWQKSNPDKTREKALRYYHNNTEVARERYNNWYSVNREEVLAKKRRHYAENKDAELRRGERYRIENPNAIRIASARYRKNNPEKVRLANKRWRENNPEKEAARRANRRARRKNAAGSHTPQDIAALYQVQEGKCFYCGCVLGDSYHVDHYIPLSKGGCNSKENLRLACAACNLSKGAKMPSEWEGCNEQI